MIRKIQFYMISCLLFFLSTRTFAQLHTNLEEEIKTIIRHETNLDADKIPGFVTAVLIGDSTFYFAFGDSEYIQQHSLTEHSIFEIGSVTSIFTALTTQEVLQKYGLNESTNLGDIFPELSNPAVKNLRIENLLTHTSGFPTRPFGFGDKELDSRNPFAYYSKEDLFRFFETWNGATDNKYLFSNVNYAVLELVLEKISGKSFASLFKESVQIPLELPNTRLSFPFQEIFPGYNVGKQMVKPWTYASFGGAVGLKSNLVDLAKFARLNFANYSGPLAQSIKDLRRMRIDTKITTNTKVGFGWHGVKFRKYFPLIALGGVTGGHTSFMAVVPETQTAVIILAPGTYEMDGLGFMILRMLNNNWKVSKRP